MTDKELLEIVANTTANEQGCKLWGGSKDACGYGRIRGHRTERKAHRAVFEAINGELPRSVLVCHKCDVRSCIEPAHLFAGSHIDNMKDMAAKGRASRAHGRLNAGEANGMARITVEAASEIKRRIRAGEQHKSIALDFGIHSTHVSHIGAGRAWKSAP